MTELQHARKDPHYPTQEEELEARRILLAAARTGDRKAKTELLESYGVKIYSEAERKKTKVVPLPTVAKQKAFERSRAVAPVSSPPSSSSRRASKKSS
jgi:hypothetical protein